MSETGSRRLSELRQELDRLTREAEGLAESLGEESRLTREEAVGAEILASRDLVAHLGIFWETAERLSAVAARQARHFADDQATTLSDLMGNPRPGALAGVLGNHLGRRLTHIAEGLGEGLEVVSDHTEKTCDAVFELWSPFFSVVFQDWNRHRHGRHG